MQISYTVQVIRANISVTNTLKSVVSDIVSSLTSPVDLSKVVLVDKVGKITEELQSYLNVQQSRSETSQLIENVKLNIHLFVEAFDNASIEHSQSDRFRYLTYLSKAHYHLALLHYILCKP